MRNRTALSCHRSRLLDVLLSCVFLFAGCHASSSDSRFHFCSLMFVCKSSRNPWFSCCRRSARAFGQYQLYGQLWTIKFFTRVLLCCRDLVNLCTNLAHVFSVADKLLVCSPCAILPAKTDQICSCQWRPLLKISFRVCVSQEQPIQRVSF